MVVAWGSLRSVVVDWITTKILSAAVQTTLFSSCRHLKWICNWKCYSKLVKIMIHSSTYLDNLYPSYSCSYRFRDFCNRCYPDEESLWWGRSQDVRHWKLWTTTFLAITLGWNHIGLGWSQTDFICMQLVYNYSLSGILIWKLIRRAVELAWAAILLQSSWLHLSLFGVAPQVHVLQSFAYVCPSVHGPIKEVHQ